MSDPTIQYPPPVPPSGPSGPRGSFGQRLVALVIDVVILNVAALVLVAITNAGLGYGLLTLLGLGYSVFFEGSQSGQTVGKRMLGIRVIDFQTGGPIGYGRALLRYVGRIASSIVCLLGYFWMLWDGEKQTWHDKIANTVVVPVSHYPVERWPG